MSIQHTRADLIIEWLANQGGKSSATNKQIAEAIGITVATTRIAEIVAYLESQDLIRIERVSPHPKRNPAGRVIHITNNTEPF